MSPNSKIDAVDLALGLLDGIEMRGRDATGAAWYSKGKMLVSKDDVPASEFCWQLMEEMDERSPLCILHTRAATKGNTTNMDNNHPINLPGMVGVHNGMLDNDDLIFRKFNLPRTAEVDSEAIFALLMHGGIEAVTKEIEGDAAIAWIDWRGLSSKEAWPIPIPDLNVAALANRPLVFATLDDGSFVFASTAHAITEALDWLGKRVRPKIVGKPEDLKDGLMMSIRRGVIGEPVKVGMMQDRWAGYAFKAAATGVKTTSVVTSKQYEKPRWEKSFSWEDPHRQEFDQETIDAYAGWDDYGETSTGVWHPIVKLMKDHTLSGVDGRWYPTTDNVVVDRSALPHSKWAPEVFADNVRRGYSAMEGRTTFDDMSNEWITVQEWDRRTNPFDDEDQDLAEQLGDALIDDGYEPLGGGVYWRYGTGEFIDINNFSEGSTN